MTTFGTIKAYGRRQARDAVGSKADTEIAGACNDAVQMLAAERVWSWYETHGSLSLQAPYTTGTITLTAGDATVTLAGGTWPTWAASGKILYGGQWLRIATRTDNTTVELATAWAEATVAGASFILYRDEYALPTDCGRFGQLYPGAGWLWGGEPVGFRDILKAYTAYSSSSQTFPRMWALYKDKIIVWPYPSETVLVNLSYYRVPVEMTADGDTVDWDSNQREVLNRAIDYQISIRFGQSVAGDVNATRSEYQVALNRAVKNERVPRLSSSWFSGSSDVVGMNIVFPG